MSKDQRGNPFGSSDFSRNDNLRTPLIDAERGSSPVGSYKSAISDLSRSLGLFQQHIDKATNLTRRIGTNRDTQKGRDAVRRHIEEGRSLISTIATMLKDFQRFVSEVSGSEKVSRTFLSLFFLFNFFCPLLLRSEMHRGRVWVLLHLFRASLQLWFCRDWITPTVFFLFFLVRSRFLLPF